MHNSIDNILGIINYDFLKTNIQEKLSRANIEDCRLQACDALDRGFYSWSWKIWAMDQSFMMLVK